MRQSRRHAAVETGASGIIEVSAADTFTAVSGKIIIIRGITNYEREERDSSYERIRRPKTASQHRGRKAVKA